MTAVLAWLSPLPATADFTEGLAAYDGGDYAAAFAEWRPLAHNGHAAAQIALADLYMQGYGVPRNPAMAVHWYHQAADQGADQGGARPGQGPLSSPLNTFVAQGPAANLAGIVTHRFGNKFYCPGNFVTHQMVSQMRQ